MQNIRGRIASSQPRTRGDFAHEAVGTDAIVKSTLAINFPVPKIKSVEKTKYIFE
jgi:hypothetical protein